MPNITIDPAIIKAAEVSRAALIEAEREQAEAATKLQEVSDKLASLKARLSSGDSTVTVPALQSSHYAQERCALLAHAADRKLSNVRARVTAPSVGVAQVIAEALRDLYPIDVVITTNRAYQPDTLPALVIVVPTSAATPRGGSVVSLRGIDLVLHRRSMLERHHEPAKIKAALEAIGWQVRVDSPDEGESGAAEFMRLAVTAGFEAVPVVDSTTLPGSGYEVADALGLRFANKDYLGPDGLLSLGYDVAPLASREADGVVTTTLGVRVAHWEKGWLKGGSSLPKLGGSGDAMTAAALRSISADLAGLIPEYGRIVSSQVETGTPAWSRQLPELKAKPLDRFGVSADFGGRVVSPQSAAFVTVQVAAKAQPVTADDGAEDIEA